MEVPFLFLTFSGMEKETALAAVTCEPQLIGLRSTVCRRIMPALFGSKHKMPFRFRLTLAVFCQVFKKRVESPFIIKPLIHNGSVPTARPCSRHLIMDR